MFQNLLRPVGVLQLHWPGFDMQACTYVEANGLFFDDSYEDTCRLPSAPHFEERVIIQMEVKHPLTKLLFIQTPILAG